MIANRIPVSVDQKLLITPKQAAAVLSISERTLYSYTKAGLIDCVYLPSVGNVQPNKLKRYALRELQRFIESRHNQEAEEKPNADLLVG